MIRTLVQGTFRFVCWVLGALTAKDCAKIRKNIYKSLEGGLAGNERRCLKWHLWICRYCFSRYEFARLMQIVTSKRVTAVRAPRRLRARVRRLTV